MKTFKIPKEPPYNTFGIITLASGTYVCPGWHKVPVGTTREQIELIEPIISPNAKRSLKVVKTPPKKSKEWKVPSSNGKKTYLIKNTPYWSCSCPANQFRRGDCKHIKKIKQDLKQKVQNAI